MDSEGKVRQGGPERAGANGNMSINMGPTKRSGLEVAKTEAILSLGTDDTGKTGHRQGTDRHHLVTRNLARFTPQLTPKCFTKTRAAEKWHLVVVISLG